MYKKLLRENITVMSVILFIILFIIIQIVKPSFLYKSDGSIREFGVGYKNKTILPIWLLSIILGILSYISIMYLVYYAN
jgi:hypothetical protein